MGTIFGNRMKKSILTFVASWIFMVSGAQESSWIFHFLKIPASAHVAALGGTNISLIEDDAPLALGNPALLSSVTDRSLNLNYMTYLKGSQAASASFSKILGQRHTLGVAGRYMSYGDMTETDETGQVMGDLSAKDIAVSGLYSYTLSGRWAGGVTTNLIYSKYAEYSSFAVGVDLGLNYFDEDADFSASLVMKNIGAQLKSFDEHTEHLPFDLQIGFTKGMAHAPIRYSVTMTDVTRWDSDYYYHEAGKKDKFGKRFFNHFVFGIDVLPTDYLYLSAGYNVRRANELKAAGSSHGAGLSFGGGLQLKRIKLGVAYAKYHVAASSLHFNLTYCM